MNATHVPMPPHDAANEGWFRRRVRAIYRHSFRDRRRERLFLASLGFFVTFGVTRLMTHLAHGRIQWAVVVGDVHVHHLVWGILLLLAVGYVWLHQAGTGNEGLSLRTERLLAMLYGVGAALTLDEFALWLNLEDVYWEREGRASIDAVMLFGGLVSAGLWGRPFLRAIARLVGKVIRRRSHEVATAAAALPEEMASGVEGVVAGVEEMAAGVAAVQTPAIDEPALVRAVAPDVAPRDRV